MNGLLRSLYGLLVTFGCDPRKTFQSMRELPNYVRNLQLLRKQSRSSARAFPLGMPHPCFGERFSDSGSARGHYFHQDLLVARRIFLNSPRIHVDVGSRVDGFVAHVASFRRIEVIDIRPLSGAIPNVTFRQANVMAPIGDGLVEYCDSLSCLHAIEHFGLGRYGDPVSCDGYLVGLENLRRMLKRSGKLYISVPIGPQRLNFDAHRVFSIGYMLALLDRTYRVDCFSFVDDSGDLHEDVSLTAADQRNNCGCEYGCGIFEMTKV